MVRNIYGKKQRGNLKASIADFAAKHGLKIDPKSSWREIEAQLRELAGEASSGPRSNRKKAFAALVDFHKAVAPENKLPVRVTRPFGR